jgi:hypothetical protein
MGVAGGVEVRVACSMVALIQVSLRSAQARTTASKAWSGDAEAPRAQPPRERSRAMEAVEREDRALARLDPEDLVGSAAVGHRENARGIALQQQARVERRGHLAA